MTAKTFSNALGNIGENYIDEAIHYTSKKKTNIVLRWGIIAACFCLAVGIVFRIAIGFVPNQMTDTYRKGNLIEITDENELPTRYDGKLLAFHLDFKQYEFYYKADGTAENTDNWYSLLAAEYNTNGDIVLHCMFGETTVEDWKVSMVFTKEATQTQTINGIEVQIARLDLSLKYEYWYYAIFEYDDVVYDIRVQSNDAGYIYEVLDALIQTE